MQRQSVSGVDEDEEALDLVKFQNAYNLASKMVSVMAEMYDHEQYQNKYQWKQDQCEYIE